jgi:hypothetical protein
MRGAVDGSTLAQGTPPPTETGGIFNVIDELKEVYKRGGVGGKLRNIGGRTAGLEWVRRAVTALDEPTRQALARGEATGQHALVRQIWAGVDNEPKAGRGMARIFGRREGGSGAGKFGGAKAGDETFATYPEGVTGDVDVFEHFLDGSLKEATEARRVLTEMLNQAQTAPDLIAEQARIRQQLGKLSGKKWIPEMTPPRKGGGSPQYLAAKQAQAFLVAQERIRASRDLIKRVLGGGDEMLDVFGAGAALGRSKSLERGVGGVESAVSEFLKHGSVEVRDKIVAAMNEHAKQITVLLASILGAEQLVTRGGPGAPSR